MIENANIITQQTIDTELPELKRVQDTFMPTRAQQLEYYEKLGWRRVVHIAEPSAGYRVVQYIAIEVDQHTCNLEIAKSANIADEQAAADAEAAKEAAAEAAAAIARLEAQAEAVGKDLRVSVLIKLINDRLKDAEPIRAEECVAEARKQLGLP